jgi:hypothetical protein
MARMISSLSTIILILYGFSGCALTQRVTEHVQDHFEKHRAIKESEHAAKRAEHENCHAEALAEAEARVQDAKRDNIDALRSTITMDIDQRFAINSMEIDETALKELMAKRDKDYDELKKLWDEIEKQMQNARTDQQLRHAENALRDLEARAQEKGCCVPHQKGMPEENAQRPPELPAKRPILPAEIPLVFKVNMRMGMENLGVENARISKIPTMPAKRPCGPTGCPSCGCQDGGCGCQYGPQQYPKAAHPRSLPHGFVQPPAPPLDLGRTKQPQLSDTTQFYASRPRTTQTVIEPIQLNGRP